MSKLNIQVLLVEDDKDYNAIMNELLSEDIVSVVSAFNGKEALELARTNKFDFVISDVQMSVMDGLTMTKALRSEGYQFPILLVTGQSEATDESARAIGALGLLHKPVDFAELLDRIRASFPSR